MVQSTMQGDEAEPSVRSKKARIASALDREQKLQRIQTMSKVKDILRESHNDYQPPFKGQRMETGKIRKERGLSSKG